MKKIAILTFCIVLAGCTKVEMASNKNIQTNSNKTVSASPTVEANVELKPVKPNVKFNARQQKYLNESLPPKVREILEKAEKFEIFAEVDLDDDRDGIDFEPNRVAVITDQNEKREVLEAFYFDASDGNYPSACYLPHHKIRATYQGKIVEIEICFECSKFYVESPFGKFDGGIIRENRKSEDVLKRIIETKSVALKQ